MTYPPHGEPQPPNDEWIVPPSVPAYDEPLPEPARAKVGWKTSAGLLAGGLALGVGAVLLVNTGSDASPSTNAAPAGANAVANAAATESGAPGVPGDPDGDGRGRPGGMPGEQHVRGTLTAVGSSSVTVKTPSGTKTYSVSSSTDIVRNGAKATLAQLKVGDPVVVHVIPKSGGGTTIERIFAGTMPARGPGGWPGGRGPGGPGGIAGEQHVRGTLTAVGSSSVTVKTSSGTKTYSVSSSADIVRNGAKATLSQLKVGDPVVVHVIPKSGGGTTVERILAGTMPAHGGPAGLPGYGPPGGDGPH